MSYEQNQNYDIMEVLNVYTKYYNTTMRTNNNMFSNIDYSKQESTNGPLEKLYEEILKFKLASEEDSTIYEYEIDYYHANNKYVLIINGNPNKSCKILFPLLVHVSTIDWTKIDWSIECI